MSVHNEPFVHCYSGNLCKSNFPLQAWCRREACHNFPGAGHFVHIQPQPFFRKHLSHTNDLLLLGCYAGGGFDVGLQGITPRSSVTRVLQLHVSLLKKIVKKFFMWALWLGLPLLKKIVKKNVASERRTISIPTLFSIFLLISIMLDTIFHFKDGGLKNSTNSPFSLKKK